MATSTINTNIPHGLTRNRSAVTMGIVAVLVLALGVLFGITALMYRGAAMPETPAGVDNPTQGVTPESVPAVPVNQDERTTDTY